MARSGGTWIPGGGERRSAAASGRARPGRLGRLRGGEVPAPVPAPAPAARRGAERKPAPPNRVRARTGAGPAPPRRLRGPAAPSRSGSSPDAGKGRAPICAAAARWTKGAVRGPGPRHSLRATAAPAASLQRCAGRAEGPAGAATPAPPGLAPPGWRAQAGRPHPSSVRGARERRPGPALRQVDAGRRGCGTGGTWPRNCPECPGCANCPVLSRRSAPGVASLHWLPGK